MMQRFVRSGARLLVLSALVACASVARAQDVVQPPTVTLSVSTGKTTAVVNWTPAGDACGGASLAVNDVRYSTSPITDCNFTSASQFTNITDGCADFNGATGVLSCNTTYYFAWKGRDSAGNWSDIGTASMATKSCASHPEVLCL